MKPLPRRRKRTETPDNHERWLITYADLITLLLIFFIIMYAMSKLDQSKYDELAQSLKFQFQSADTVMPQGSGIMDRLRPTQEPTAQDTERDREALERERQLEDLLEKVQAYIEQNNLQGHVSVGDTPRGVAVSLNDLFLFDLGKAELKPEAYPILNQLATLFPTLNASISIEGHTDNLPVLTGSPFKDNWGLSQARSLSVLRYFVDDAGLDPNKFVSTAYADTRPIAPNDSDANRQKNRRVEIVVLREFMDDTRKAVP